MVFGDGDVAVLVSIVVVDERGNEYWSLARFLGVLVAALQKDLVMERPPKTYSATPSYMALD